jgi:hypothetical protein
VASAGVRARRAVAALASIATLVLLTGCGGSDSDARVQSRDGRPGLTLNGTVEGRQLAVRDGTPELIVGDCDPRTPPDEDVCAISQTIGGDVFVLAVENPDVLTSDATVEVAHSSCRGPECDGISDHAVVDVQVGSGARLRATGGELRLRTIEPYVYYSGSVRLELPDGRLSGEFDLVPRPD